MRAHAFADMMYVLYESFGLFEKGDKLRETRENSGYSFHQKFASQCYFSVAAIVDTSCIFSKEQRRDILFKYEQLYNNLMHIPVFSHSNNSQITKLYLQKALPLIVALEIYKTFNPDDENHFYYHIHQFLMSRYCPCGEGNSETPHMGVRAYLRDYIASLNFSYKGHLAPILGYIENIRKGKVQKIGTIKQNILLSSAEYNNSLILRKDISANKARLIKIERSYIALNVLLEFERHTTSIGSLSLHYREMVKCGVNDNACYDILHRYIYSPGYDETLLHQITSEWYRDVIIPFATVIRDEQYRDIYELRKIVFDTNLVDKYSGWDFIRMNSCLSLKSHSDVLNPYRSLLTLICLMSQEDLNSAWKLVNNIEIEQLPIGFLPSAFSAIKLALKIKLERKTIRNGVLLSLVNNTLANQGVFTDYRVLTKRGEKSPLILSANNMVIMRAVKMYNCMIRKISYLHEVEPYGVYPHAIFGLLKKVDDTLGKINHLLQNNDDNISSEKLARLIVENEVVTVQKLNDNMIGIINECTLYQCIVGLNVLVDYLRCPGETVSNVIMLAGISEKSKYERRRLCEALELIAGTSTLFVKKQ